MKSLVRLSKPDDSPPPSAPNFVSSPFNRASVTAYEGKEELSLSPSRSSYMTNRGEQFSNKDAPDGPLSSFSRPISSSMKHVVSFGSLVPEAATIPRAASLPLKIPPQIPSALPPIILALGSKRVTKEIRPMSGSTTSDSRILSSGQHIKKGLVFAEKSLMLKIMAEPSDAVSIGPYHACPYCNL